MSITTALKPLTKVAVKSLGRTGFIIRKYSPEILTSVGVVGVVTAAVLASKATLHLEPIVDVTKNGLEYAKTKTHERTAEEYSSNDHTREVIGIYARSAGSIVKLYGPSVTLGIASIACIISAHGLLQQRNLAVIAAYKGLEQTFSEYRKRVVDEFGEEKDASYYYGTHKETVKNEDGTETEVEVVDRELTTANVKFFDVTNQNWTPHPNVNLNFVTAQQTMINHTLQAQGHVFLNEVLDMLGLERTKAGSVTGWVYHKNAEDNLEGDNYISFGIRDLQSGNSQTFGTSSEDGDCILLDFNIDGVIFDKLPDN